MIINPRRVHRNMFVFWLINTSLKFAWNTVVKAATRFWLDNNSKVDRTSLCSKHTTQHHSFLFSLSLYSPQPLIVFYMQKQRSKASLLAPPHCFAFPCKFQFNLFFLLTVLSCFFFSFID